MATEGCNTRGDFGMSIEVSLHLAAPRGVQQVIDEAVQVVFGKLGERTSLNTPQMGSVGRGLFEQLHKPCASSGQP